MKHRNAIILAAGTSSRFVPLSYEKPKGLLEVKGEILIERQIRQLKEAGIVDITVVVGYMADLFIYLKDKFNVSIVYNEDFAIYNNTSSMIRVLDKLGNTFICSSDNYFPNNVFKTESESSYYSALYSTGYTNEYCMKTDNNDNIIDVTVGGEYSWYMVGHVYFNKEFSKAFGKILKKQYERKETRIGYWEDLYVRYINYLPHMKIKRFQQGDIMEFDSLGELRNFDNSYIKDTRSEILQNIAVRLGCSEAEMYAFNNVRNSDGIRRFSFRIGNTEYQYDVDKNQLIPQ